MTAGLIFGVVRGGDRLTTIFPYAAMLVLHLLAYGVSRTGHLRLAVAIFVGFYLAIVTFVMFRYGGMRSPAGFVLPPVVLFAGLTWNGRAALATAGAAALVTLVRSVARLVLEGGAGDGQVGPEVLEENRFLAARDGLDARLIDPVKRTLVPVRTLMEVLLAACRRHGDEAAVAELDRVRRLVATNGAQRQRYRANQDGLAGLVTTLAQRFTSSGDRSRLATPTD